MDAALGKQKICYLIYLHASLLNSSRASCRPEHTFFLPWQNTHWSGYRKVRRSKIFSPKKNSILPRCQKSYEFLSSPTLAGCKCSYFQDPSRRRNGLIQSDKWFWWWGVESNTIRTQSDCCLLIQCCRNNKTMKLR